MQSWNERAREQAERREKNAATRRAADARARNRWAVIESLTDEQRAEAKEWALSQVVLGMRDFYAKLDLRDSQTLAMHACRWAVSAGLASPRDLDRDVTGEVSNRTSTEADGLF